MPASDALRAWFLGPRAENAELFERLVTEALRDHVFWRRNYHPEDGFTIREQDKRREGYEEAVSTLTQELMGLLAELKRGVPFYSGRYKGHMVFEQTIAAQVGYFATMLYNPNNVSIEASPVTSRLELEVASQLANMVGYEPARAWGHLTSGGTVANFEALWIARNVLYLPVAAAGAARELGVQLEVRLPSGDMANVAELPLYRLLNIRNADAMDLWSSLWKAAPAPEIREVLESHSLSTLGYQGYDRYLSELYDDTLPDAVVLVAATAHYSWEKIVRALGIGSNQLLFVPLNDRFRMDTDALWSRVLELATQRVPILACVSVCGTTEESAVDRLDQVLEVRARAERELGITFHVHSDACYGGYAASVTWRQDGSRRSVDELRAATECSWPDDGVLESFHALANADSITIDPHKLGYIPYPAGAFLLRDRRARDLVAVDPPYLLPTQGLHEEDLFLGRFIFEGSKPGAAAAAVWLSHKVLPLDERGYGYLIERTICGARKLHAALSRARLGQFSVIMLPEPDINIVCFLLRHNEHTTLAEVNELNEAIYARMSMQTPGDQPEYVITRTRLQTPMYDGAIEPILGRLGIGSVDEWRASGQEGLVVLRSTVMDPYLQAGPPTPDHLGGFVSALGRAAQDAHRSVVTIRPG